MYSLRYYNTAISELTMKSLLPVDDKHTRQLSSSLSSLSTVYFVVLMYVEVCETFQCSKTAHSVVGNLAVPQRPRD